MLNWEKRNIIDCISDLIINIHWSKLSWKYTGETPKQREDGGKLLLLFEAKLSNWRWMNVLLCSILTDRPVRNAESFLIGKKRIADGSLACMQEMRITHTRPTKCRETSLRPYNLWRYDAIVAAKLSALNIETLCMPGATYVRIDARESSQISIVLHTISHELGFSICIDKCDIVCRR